MAITSSSTPATATMLNNKKRARVRGSGVVTMSSATATAAEIAKCAQAPREKLRNRPPDNTAMMTTLESRMVRVITPINSRSSGKIKNGP